MYFKEIAEAQPPEDAGRYGRTITALRKQGKQPPGLYYLFAQRADAAKHLAGFMQCVMRGPSDLSAGQRELIAAMVSARNHCKF